MGRHASWLVTVFMLVLLIGCEEAPRKREITFPEDFAKTQSCQSACQRHLDEASVNGELCIASCESKYQQVLDDCNPLAGKDATRWRKCRMAALDELEACQDTCSARVERMTEVYNSCMKDCQQGK